jgi:RNA polymerase sigma factor (sigma-70 family)
MVNNTEYNNAIREYSRNLLRFVAKSLKDEKAAEDIVQDCFLKLWEHRNNVDARKLKSWLFTTAHHHLINYLKRASKFTSEEFAEISIPAVSDFDIRELIDKALDQLPQTQKSIILLRDLEGYSYEEIADIMQLSDAQVKVYLFRGRQKIKELLKSVHTIIGI